MKEKNSTKPLIVKQENIQFNTDFNSPIAQNFKQSTKLDSIQTTQDYYENQVYTRTNASTAVSNPSFQIMKRNATSKSKQTIMNNSTLSKASQNSSPFHRNVQNEQEQTCNSSLSTKQRPESVNYSSLASRKKLPFQFVLNNIQLKKKLSTDNLSSNKVIERKRKHQQRRNLYKQ